MGLSLAQTSQAQIASYVDRNGKVIYVNANPRIKVPRHTRADGQANNQASQGAPVKLASVVNKAAERNNVDPALVQAVIQNESAWNPNAVSPKGAFGLMQLIPSTAERFGVGNVFDPAENIEGGTRYLRELLDRYHGDLKKSLAAYNAGEQAVARFGGVPLYPETRSYVRKVTNTYFQSGSGHSPTGEFHHFQIRQATDRSGRVVFTNE
ncbi:MAG TPA: lytic transglycosylase domain-containing protein [Candidatus Acidoferrales bacterium]|nr:lytic transglycosylase domain-containing protein [Candidatus Acidoferrales bacterium]